MMDSVLVRERDASSVVVCLSGELDGFGCEGVESTIQAAIAQWSRVLVDVSAVTFCSSGGLGIFIRCAEAAREHDAQVFIVNLPRHLQRLIDITGLQHLLAT